MTSKNARISELLDQRAKLQRDLESEYARADCAGRILTDRFGYTTVAEPLRRRPDVFFTRYVAPEDGHQWISETDLLTYKDAAAAEARSKALSLVLEALEIPGYAAGGILSGPRAGKKFFDADRFAADLETALRVRVERITAANEAATEERVAAMASPAMIAYGFVNLTPFADATSEKPAKKKKASA